MNGWGIGCVHIGCLRKIVFAAPHDGKRRRVVDGHHETEREPRESPAHGVIQLVGCGVTSATLIHRVSAGVAVKRRPDVSELLVELPLADPRSPVPGESESRDHERERDDSDRHRDDHCTTRLDVRTFGSFTAASVDEDRRWGRPRP